MATIDLTDEQLAFVGEMAGVGFISMLRTAAGDICSANYHRKVVAMLDNKDAIIQAFNFDESTEWVIRHLEPRVRARKNLPEVHEDGSVTYPKVDEDEDG